MRNEWGESIVPNMQRDLCSVPDISLERLDKGHANKRIIMGLKQMSFSITAYWACMSQTATANSVYLRK